MRDTRDIFVCVPIARPDGRHSSAAVVARATGGHCCTESRAGYRIVSMLIYQYAIA